MENVLEEQLGEIVGSEADNNASDIENKEKTINNEGVYAKWPGSNRY